MSTLLSLTEMRQAYLTRDASYNGLFFFGVRTTGIFCRPTCPARKPLPKNVEYFATAREALNAGYRPCKRCLPCERDDQPKWAVALLNDLERDPSKRITDADLAARGVDPATVRRYFLKRFGMTFQAFARARRLSGALHQVRAHKPLDDVITDSGYESQSGFREAFRRLFGESPSKQRDGECIRLAWLPSPLGPLVAGATSDGLCLLEFSEAPRLETQLAAVKKLFKLPVIPGTNAHLETLKHELVAYFEGRLREFTMPLVYPGTPFQKRVWEQLLKIPFGATQSYEDLARAVGVSNGARAVGRANGLNRMAIVIPCHRVVNKNGQLGGYGGGLRRKEFLLSLERDHKS